MTIDEVTLSPAGVISVRMVDDHGAFSRHTRQPGDPVDDIPAALREAVEALWTPDFVAAWRARQSSELAQEPGSAASIADVTAAQARIALLNAGLLDGVEAMVATLAESDRAAATWFEYATTWRRDNPYVTSLGAALGLTATQIDDLFVAAAAIAE